MEKNTIVLDELGRKIGETYSKRARGLVKNGRAEYVDDQTIRMKTTHDPAILIDFLNDMEERKMSKVINFNAREFKFDETCQGVNKGSRMFVTDMFDEATETFEIGEIGAWTQIKCDKVLEKESDYVFRFGILRENIFPNTTSQFIIVPNDCWDDRFVFNLTNDQFKPKAIKKWNDADLRIYEIPFNTGDVENYRFVIVEFNSTARIFPVKELEAYQEMEDSTGESTKGNRANFNFSQIMPNFDFSGFEDFGKKAGETVKSAFNKVSHVFNGNATEPVNESGSINYEMRMGVTLNAAEVKDLFDKVGEGGNIQLSGCTLCNADGEVDWGETYDGMSIDVCGCNVSDKTYAGTVKKIGDGSNVKMIGCRISGDYFDACAMEPAAGVSLDLSGTTLSPDALALLMRKIGDGANVNLKGTVISGDYTEADFGGTVDGINVTSMPGSIPAAIKDKIVAKFGDGCNWQE